MNGASSDIKIACVPSPPISSIHYLPCKVECDGMTSGESESNDGCAAAKVDTYFTPVIRPINEETNLSTTKEDETKSSQVYSATFRGRGLKGVKVTVPEGFVGCVLKEPNHEQSEEEREFKVQSEFEEFMYWNLQTTPTADDKLAQAMTWNSLAQTLHKPVPTKQD